jgi:hypothetical protein
VHRGEAEALVASLERIGLRVARSASPRVVTSARWETAIEGGFASFLGDLREARLAELAAPAAA